MNGKPNDIMMRHIGKMKHLQLTEEHLMELRRLKEENENDLERCKRRI
jgi:hypothetical protein